MASSGKKKTTMAKLMRESKLRERRLDKQAKREARKHAPAESTELPADAPTPLGGEPAQPDAEQPALTPVAQANPQ
jgi:hypothetical protein